MKFCYFNNGLSMTSVGDDYAPQSGEVLFTVYPTSQQLSESFPEYSSLAANESIKLQILALEATQTLRRIREAAAGTDNGWLNNLNSQIAALRGQMS